MPDTDSSYNDARGLLRSAGHGPRHRDLLTRRRRFWLRSSTVAEFERLPNRLPKDKPDAGHGGA